MSKQLVPILADAMREYYTGEDLAELFELFDVKIEWNHARNEPFHLQSAKRLIAEIEQGNNRRLLETLLPSLFTRSSEMVAKHTWERRDYHQEMQGRLNDLRPLLGSCGAPNEVTVPDSKPFTAKSEIRELLANANGPVFLIDAYVGIGTLDCLREVAHPIRILTGQQKQSVESGFESSVKDFLSEGRALEVRRHPKLHDRHLIFNERCWLIGSSIKDAGKKALNIIECLDSKRLIVEEAEKKWTEGVVYL
jgi:hypothetical protein